MSTINSKVVNATKWSAITEFSNKLILPVVNIILARLLTPTAFGVVATITMIISFAEIFADAGFQKYIVQHEFESDDEKEKSITVAFWSNFLLSLVMWLIIVIFRYPIARLVGSEGYENAIVVACISLPLVAFSSIQTSVLRRNFDFKSLFKVRIAGSLTPIFVTVPLAFLFRSYWALIVGTIANNMVVAIIITLKSSWKPRFFYKFKYLKEMLSFSTWTLFEQLLFWVTSYIGTFLISNVLTSHYVGIYKSGMTTVNQILSLITATIMPVLFSTLSRLQNDDRNFEDAFLKFQKVVAIFLVPLGVGIFLYRELIVAILLGDGWTDAITLVGIWGMSSSLATVFTLFCSEAFRAKGYPKLSVYSQILHLVVLIPTIYITVRINFDTLAYARSLIRFQLVLIYVIFTKKYIGISIRKMIFNLIPPVISTLVMGLAVIELKRIYTSMIWDFVCIFIAVIVYFSFLFVFPSFRKEIKLYLNMIKGMLKKTT